VHLVDDLGLGYSDVAGSYCLKTGTEYDQQAAWSSMDCDRFSENCGDADS
jgi:hypothetical protein